MKKLIFILFSLFSLIAQAQERQVTTISDTTYIVWFDGLGYERHDIDYEGPGIESFINPVPIGDTAAVTKYLFSNAINANQEVGGAAIQYLNGEPVARQVFSTFNTMFQALTGTTLQVAAANYFKDQILGNYRLTLPTNESAVYELVQQPNGTLRMRLKSNQATFFTAVAMSQNTLRLNSLDAGANVPFYLVGTNANGKPLYFSIDRRYKLVRL